MAAVAVAVRVLGALDGGVVERRCVAALLRQRVADMARNRAAGAVIAALLDPLLQRLDRRCPRVVFDGRRLRDRVRLHARDAGRFASTRSTTAFSEA